uniref:Potassium channel domain-containing protein n=1 Tax=Ditylenchus dipsaci TaxID=166011 RepID=A0A915E3S2_9BILA
MAQKRQTWRQNKEGFEKGVFICLPYLISVFLVSIFILSGAIVFRYLDESIAAQPWCYGKVVPRNSSSQLFCVVYSFVGIPMMFLLFSNTGKLLAKSYWLMYAWCNNDKELILSNKCYLPLKFVLLMIILHSLIGGIIFHVWIDEMPYVTAIYFSFISITTIGYGDLNPNPDNLIHTLIIIIYLSTGLVVMSRWYLLSYMARRRLLDTLERPDVAALRLKEVFSYDTEQHIGN